MVKKIIFILLCSSSSVYSAIIVGGEGTLYISDPANPRLPSSLLYGVGALLEFGFEPNASGLSLNVSRISGKEYQLIDKDTSVLVSQNSLLFSFMLKYNFPIAFRLWGGFGLFMTQLLYVLNPWLGIGPGFQYISSIKSSNSDQTASAEITNPGSDFITQFGGGVHINIGMLVNYLGIKSRLRNLYLLFDFRYMWNLGFLEEVALSSSSSLLSQFTGFYKINFGFGYRLPGSGKK